MILAEEQDGKRLAHGYAVVDRRPSAPLVLIVKPSRGAAREWRQHHDLLVPGVTIQRVKLTVYGS